ncbi:solute carrier family 35 member G1-like [Apostichopus japonicus]|uniref:solute carrier family 35 member G1-like n=1 Tax=Stichopus japonicus TaxID=307972 RepID=UPI003AB55BB0
MTSTDNTLKWIGQELSSRGMPMIGIFYATLSAICFSTEDMILYQVIENFHPAFIFVCNSFVVLCLCFMFAVIVRLRWRPVSSTQVLLIILYGSFDCTSQMAISLSIFSIGPGNAVALFFTLTIFSVIFSVTFLKVKPRLKDLFFAICSTGGVALIALALQQEDLSKEGFSLPTPYGICSAILAAMSFSGSLVVGRKLACYENSHFLVNLLSYSGQYLLISLILCSFLDGWSLPRTPIDVFMLTGTGVTTFGGFLFGYLAVCREKPTTVSIILTSEIVMTYVGQFILFNFSFQWQTLAGSVLIIFSCIGTIVSEEVDEISDREAVSEVEGKEEDEQRPILK